MASGTSKVIENVMPNFIDYDLDKVAREKNLKELNRFSDKFIVEGNWTKDVISRNLAHYDVDDRGSVTFVWNVVTNK